VINAQNELKFGVDLKTFSAFFTGVDKSGNGIWDYDEVLQFYV
jgi:hypothetical protein